MTKHLTIDGTAVAIFGTKYIGDEDPYYNTKISIFSFTWAGLAAFFSSDKI